MGSSSINARNVVGVLGKKPGVCDTSEYIQERNLFDANSVMSVLAD